MVTRGRRDREGLRTRLAARWNRAAPGSHFDIGVQRGTCLRKCYYETYRFSEDLDFTIMMDGNEDPRPQPIFVEVARWLREESGVELLLDPAALRRRRNRRERPTTQGRIAYRGPNITRGTLPKVKFDLTSDEVLVVRPVLRQIGHQYSDRPLPVRGVLAYPIAELFGEKLRALADAPTSRFARCRVLASSP